MNDPAPRSDPARHPAEPARRAAAVWRKLLLSLITVVICLGAIELLLRLKYRRSFAKHEDARYAFMRSPNPRLIYEMRPSHTAVFPGTPVPLRTNSAGFRDREFTPKPPGRFRIVVIGDSVTVGWEVPAHQTYPKVLERLLAQDPGGDADVFNMGVGGYNTLQELEVIKTKALQHEPDLILIGYVLNDRVLWGRDGGATRYFLHSGCMLLDQVRLRWARLKYRFGDDLVTVAFRQLAAFLEPRGIPVLIVVFPFLEGDDGHYAYQDGHDHVAGLAQRHGFELLDLFPRYCAAGLATLRSRAHDIIHPNQRGHRIAAEAIHAYLRARGLEREPRPDPPH